MPEIFLSKASICVWIDGIIPDDFRQQAIWAMCVLESPPVNITEQRVARYPAAARWLHSPKVLCVLWDTGIPYCTMLYILVRYRTGIYGTA